MRHPCLSLHAKFQPNWSKYKFLPYLGILFGPKNLKITFTGIYVTLVLVYMQNFSPIGVSTSSYHIWAYCLGPKIHIFENYLTDTCITLVLLYIQNFSPIGVSTSSYHIWAYCLGPKIHIFDNYLHRYMHHPFLK